MADNDTQPVTESTVTEPTVTETTPTQPVTETTVTETTPTQPVTEPTVTETTPTQPVTEPTVTETTATEPTPTQPVTEPTVTEPTVTEPTPPITIDDVINSVECVKVKENSDKAILESIGNTSNEVLKTKLIQWGTVGFPDVYVILKIVIEPPAVCSDGISRKLSDYIQYCSGKTINEHVAVLQDKVKGITVSFVKFESYIGIVVSKHQV